MALGKDWMVNVQPGSWGKVCYVHGKKQRCGKKPKFMVFNLDGQPKSSRLDSACCEDHLPRAVKLAFEENCAKRIEREKPAEGEGRGDG